MHLKKRTTYVLFVFLTLLSCQDSNTDSVTFKATTHLCNEQIVQQESLIVAEYLQNYHGKGGNYTYLTRYNFKSGKLVSKDTILGAPSRRNDGMALKGLLSPDLKHGLEVDMANRRLKPFTKPFKIILHNAQEETKNIVEDCGFGALPNPKFPVMSQMYLYFGLITRTLYMENITHLCFLYFSQ